jgi:hypothetical protein
MWVAVTFAAIGLIGMAFMLLFLVGLLHERAPFTCYWIIRQRTTHVRQTSKVLNRIYIDDCRVAGIHCSDYNIEY